MARVVQNDKFEIVRTGSTTRRQRSTVAAKVASSLYAGISREIDDVIERAADKAKGSGFPGDEMFMD